MLSSLLSWHLSCRCDVSPPSLAGFAFGPVRGDGAGVDRLPILKLSPGRRGRGFCFRGLPAFWTVILNSSSGPILNSLIAFSIATSQCQLRPSRCGRIVCEGRRRARGASLITRHCLTPRPILNRSWCLSQALQDALNHRGGFAESVTDLAIRGTVAPHDFHSLKSGLLVSVRNELVVNHVEAEWRPASAVETFRSHVALHGRMRSRLRSLRGIVPREPGSCLRWAMGCSARRKGLPSPTAWWQSAHSDEVGRQFRAKPAACTD